jgi:CHAD domain-containing protein
MLRGPGVDHRSDPFVTIRSLPMRVTAELFDSLRRRVRAFSHESKRLHGDADALHRTRVASRRLRELLPILRLDADTTRKLSRRLRQVTRRLSDVRDFDVLISLIADLHRDRRYSKKTLKTVEDSVAERRKDAHERLAARLPPAKIQRLARRLKRVVRHLESGDEPDRRAGKPRLVHASVWALEARTARRAERVREAVQSAGTVYAPVALHNVRIALKKLRFALELQAEAQQQRAARDVAALKTSQDVLGRLHDVQVLIDYAREMQESQTGPDKGGASRDLGALLRMLERDCRHLHARYVRNSSSLIAIAADAGSMNVAAARAARRELRRHRLA